MLDITKYCVLANIWPGIFSYVQDHLEMYSPFLKAPFTDEDLLKMLKKKGKAVLLPKEYDSFRKAVTALRKGTVCSLKRENLYRLCFVLELGSDAQAQDLFLNYLHQNELSPRSLDDFILIASLKLQFSWEETCRLRAAYHEQINAQAVSPDTLDEGNTLYLYDSIVGQSLKTPDDLARFLEAPGNLSFFAKTRNTQYLALFDDVELELLYNGDQEQLIRLITNYGSSENDRPVDKDPTDSLPADPRQDRDRPEKETIRDYYSSLFGLQDIYSDDSLSEDEIALLCNKFGHVFMTYDNFCLLVQRKRQIDISSGTFMLNLIKKLLTEDEDSCNDFYIDFLDPHEFTGVCNDILIYFGLPVLNPSCDNFDRLLLDVYQETLDENPSVTNTRFQELYLGNLRKYLRLIAYSQS